MGKKYDYKAASALAFERIASWCPGYVTGRVSGRERAIRSPIRDDKRPGSFFVNEDTGEWFDHATQEGGDTLALYAKIKGLRMGEARAEIMGEAYDPAEDIDVDPILRAKNVAALADEELKKEYLAITEPKNKNQWPLVRYGDMAIEPPKWLIKGILEANALGVVFGASGHGKSFFVLDLAACISSGADFHGREVKQKGAVIYIAGEGHAGLSRRLRAWEIHRGVSIKNSNLFISSKPAALCDDDYMMFVRDTVASVGMYEKVELIIVDTWARNMAGDENSTVDTTKAIRAVDELRALYGCTGLIVHHSGQAESERGRGSSALRAALDIEYKVEINGEILMVKNTKMKDGEPPEPMTFAFEPVELGVNDDDGDPIFSSALKEIVLDGIIKPRKKGVVQGKILEALKANDGEMDKEKLRESMQEVTKSSFYYAIKSLKDSGEIVANDQKIWLKE